MKYDAIIIGGGIAGLTTAAFLAKAGSLNIALREGGQMWRSHQHV